MNKFLILLLCISLGFGLSVEAKSKNYNVYTPTVYKQSNLVQSGVGVKGDVIELVVDYSGSMEYWIGLAKSTLQSILPKISNQTNVGLRVFGQSTNQFFIADVMTSCKASRLVSFPRPSNSASVLSALNSTKIGSATPLTFALERTVYQDFAPYPLNVKKKIVLVTDGEDTCNGDPCAFVRKLSASRSDITIDVIIVNGSDNLRCLADSTGGKYYKIGTDNDFNNAMGVSFGTQPDNSYKPQNTAPKKNGNSVHYEFIK